MQLIKLTTKQKELLETEVKPLLTNDLSFNVELVNSILAINYRKIDICTIVKYTKEHLIKKICVSKYNYGYIHILNVNKNTMYATITIYTNLDHYEYEKDGEDYFINLYARNGIIAFEDLNTYIFNNVAINLKDFQYNNTTNDLQMLV